jgi:hypothetical protein
LSSPLLIPFCFSIECHTKGKINAAIKNKTAVPSKKGKGIHGEKYLKDNLLKVSPTTNPKHNPNQILFFKDVEYIILLFKFSAKEHLLKS